MEKCLEDQGDFFGIEGAGKYMPLSYQGGPTVCSKGISLFSKQTKVPGLWKTQSYQSHRLIFKYGKGV
jgi:hypothetical protein